MHNRLFLRECHLQSPTGNKFLFLRPSIQNFLNDLANSQTNTLPETITNILIWAFQVLTCEFFLCWQLDLVPDEAQWAAVSLWTVAQREENLLLISTSNLSIYPSSHQFSYTGLRGAAAYYWDDSWRTRREPGSIGKNVQTPRRKALPEKPKPGPSACDGQSQQLSFQCLSSKSNL